MTERQYDDFYRNGFLVLPGFYDFEKEILSIQQAIYEIIGIVAKKNNISLERSDFTSATFDEGYLEIIRHNRQCGGEIYDAVKQIPAFLRLVSDRKNEQLVSVLRRGSLPGIAAAGFGLRINNPHEDKFRANWHQEYPAQLRSLDGIVFWSPLVEVTKDIGPVRICPGSHLLGALPVYTQDPRNKEKQGAYALVLQNEKELVGKFEQIAPLSKPGDLILMDFLLLHASGFNRSNRALWSMQFRYFNYLEPNGISHGWKGSFASGVDFKNVHPELCVDGE